MRKLTLILILFASLSFSETLVMRVSTNGVTMYNGYSNPLQTFYINGQVWTAGSGSLYPDFDTTGYPSESVAWMSAFDPPVSNITVDAAAPAIAEWTRTVNSTDTFALTGEDLTSGFVAYGVGVTNTPTVALLDGQECALTMASLPVDEMYFLWPTNSFGYGDPVALNKTELWWITDTVSTGSTFSVYGRNLALGSNDSYLFYSNNTTAATGWLTNSTYNPYMATFACPDVVSGTYTIWAHNGKGRGYGWSESASLTVEYPVLWNDTPATWLNVVDDYSADPATGNDDETAIETAIAAARDGDTVYFPDGEYSVTTTKWYGYRIRLLGQSTNAIVKADLTTGAYLFQHDAEGSEIDSLAIAAGAGSHRTYALIYIDKPDLTVRDCFLDTSAWDLADAGKGNIIDIRTGSSHISFSNCYMHVSASGGVYPAATTAIPIYDANQIFFEDCTFKLINDCPVLFTLYGDETSFVNCTQDNYLNTVPDNGENVGIGRFLAIKASGSSWGNPQNVYVGGCSLLNTGPRPSHGNQNSGEVILGESPQLVTYSVVSSSTANTVQLTTPSTWQSLSDDQTVTIVSGKGFGQTRHSISATTDTLTFDEDWNVEPDGTSTIIVTDGTGRLAVYNNYFSGRAGINAAAYTPNSAVETYVSGRDWVIDSNEIVQTRSGFNEFSFNRAPSDGALAYPTPNYFMYFANNTISNTYFGIANHIRLRVIDDDNVDYPLNVGTVWRNNTMDSVVSTDIVNGEITGGMKVPITLIQRLEVYDSNIMTNSTTAYSIRYGFTNQVYIGNTLEGAGWTP